MRDTSKATNGKKGNGNVERVTVSLPKETYARAQRIRKRQSRTMSNYVMTLIDADK